jgi:integrase
MSIEASSGRNQARTALRKWAKQNARRDELVTTAWQAGLDKTEIHTLTGLSRPTIDRILDKQDLMTSGQRAELVLNQYGIDVDHLVAVGDRRAQLQREQSLAPQNPPQTLTRDQIQRLLADSSIPVAHRALWSALVDRAGRVRELLDLDITDLDLAADPPVASVEDRAAGRRPIPLTDQTATLFAAATAGHTKGPVFADPNGHALRQNWASQVARQHGTALTSFRNAGHRLRSEDQA